MFGELQFSTYYSPPTNVTVLRDGQPVTVDGSGYEMILTIANRGPYSTRYSNKLLIRNAVDLIGYHTYTCIVSNYAGNTNNTVETVFIGIVVIEKV